ncbi:energy transducer TonB [Glaciecola sp. 1036]|uniref:energy transducer TonB n=1 Tax=Alteromonadaceae TaxID=72275 RepID=UPI003D074717
MIRFIIALFCAAAITLGLFFVMQYLIKTGGGEMGEPPQGKVLDFVRVKQEEQVEQKDRKPRKPPKPEQPPPQMQAPPMESSSPDAGSAGMDFSADVSADVGLEGGASLGAGDGDFVPIARQQAVYPRRAMQRGIQGYVIVEFTVTKLGTVKDPVVVKAEPEGIFEQAAINSVLGYKYKARIINGEAVDVAGVQTQVTFELN